jgi:opacity protein-like surface antigen
MRRLLIAIGLIGMMSDAFAADLDDLPMLRGSDTFVPAFPAYPSWEGFYVGGHATYGNANADFSNATQPLAAFSLRNSTLGNEFAPDRWPVLGTADTGAAGLGGFAGYNTQWDNAVIGMEFNYTHSSLNAGASSNPIERIVSTSDGITHHVLLTGSGSMHVEDFASLRARFGWVAGQFMPYAMIGLAVGSTDTNISETIVDVQTKTGSPPAIFSDTQTKSKNPLFLYGYSAGLGFDFALTRHIFARVEYEYIQWLPVWQITSHLNMARLGVGVKL